MSSLKILAAVAAAATVSLAFAQSTPPQPAATDPAVGAGQQSTQATPMGATGTPGSGETAVQGSTTTVVPAVPPTTSSGAGPATLSTTPASPDAGMAASDSSARPARADRN